MAIIKEIRKAKEHIKHSQHKNDGKKIALSLTSAGGTVVGGVAAAVGTATSTVATGAASVLGIQIGGGLGAWLVAHGATAATVAVTTTTFALPVFLGIALPALALGTGYTLLKNYQNNRDIKDFNTTVDIDTLGEKMAECIFYPAVYFSRTLGVSKEAIQEYLPKAMIKEYGFEQEFADEFVKCAVEMPLETLKSKISEQSADIEIDVNGKSKVTHDLDLKFLREKSLNLCNSALMQSCYSIGNDKLSQAKETIKYMKRYLFKGKNYTF